MRITIISLLLLSVTCSVSADEFTADRVTQLKSYLASTGCEVHKTCQQELDKLPMDEDDFFEKIARCQVLGLGDYVSGGCYHLLGD